MVSKSAASRPKAKPAVLPEGPAVRPPSAALYPAPVMEPAPLMTDPTLLPVSAASGTGMEAAAIVLPVAMAAVVPAVLHDLPAPDGNPAMLRIRSKQEGFRRAGLVFSKDPREIAMDTLDERQLAALRAEPMLLIEDI